MMNRSVPAPAAPAKDPAAPAKDPPPETSAAHVIFTQSEDSAGRVDEETQEITIEITDAGAGPYLVISTTRWAIERPEDLLSLLRRVWALNEPTPHEH